MVFFFEPTRTPPLLSYFPSLGSADNFPFGNYLEFFLCYTFVDLEPPYISFVWPLVPALDLPWSMLFFANDARPAALFFSSVAESLSVRPPSQLLSPLYLPPHQVLSTTGPFHFAGHHRFLLGSLGGIRNGSEVFGAWCLIFSNWPRSFLMTQNHPSTPTPRAMVRTLRDGSRSFACLPSVLFSPFFFSSPSIDFPPFPPPCCCLWGLQISLFPDYSPYQDMACHAGNDLRSGL